MYASAAAAAQRRRRQWRDCWRAACITRASIQRALTRVPPNHKHIRRIHRRIRYIYNSGLDLQARPAGEAADSWIRPSTDRLSSQGEEDVGGSSRTVDTQAAVRHQSGCDHPRVDASSRHHAATRRTAHARIMQASRRTIQLASHKFSVRLRRWRKEASSARAALLPRLCYHRRPAGRRIAADITSSTAHVALYQSRRHGCALVNTRPVWCVSEGSRRASVNRCGSLLDAVRQVSSTPAREEAPGTERCT